jgi:type IV pilus assembly protein PilW
MKPRYQPSFTPSPRAAVRGFSLVELLVSLAISMVVVIGAFYVYLATSQTQRALIEKAFATETAHYALDVLGRDLENAGFYPSIRVTGGTAAVATVTVQTYVNPVTTGSIPAAYNAAVFGCNAQTYKPAPDANPVGCAAHAVAAVNADTLVLNSYSNDSYGLNIGNRADCLRQDSANDLVNVLRKNPTVALTPLSPLFVSNRYTLLPTTVKIEGQTINTFGLACNGNGVNPAADAYYPMVAGIDQLRFYYLVRTSATASSKFQRADAVAAADWPNVVSVRVCLMARSMQASKLQGSTSYSINDCDGVSKSFTDGVERRIFTQVFALKNHSQLLNVP